jgi:hypothetical protein
MTSLARRYAVRFALGSALLASACQNDSNADFDEGGLMSPDTGGSGASDAGGSDAAAGVDSGGSSAGGTANGGKASGGDASQGGKANAGAGGVATVGGKGGSSNGGSSNGGKAGTAAGGAPPQAGKAGMGGLAGSATAGSGGTVGIPPEPVTFETTDIDDTYVASCFPSMNYGALLSMNVDGDGDGNDSCTYQILIIAPLSGIPAGALVSEATLTLTCTNAGDPITVSYVNEAWKELMVRYNTRPEAGAALGTVTCEQPGDEVTINLTSAVKAWLAGDHAAHGIYLRTEDSDGTDFATSEALSTSTRPAFRVTYTLPVK